MINMIVTVALLVITWVVAIYVPDIVMEHTLREESVRLMSNFQIANEDLKVSDFTLFQKTMSDYFFNVAGPEARWVAENKADEIYFFMMLILSVLYFFCGVIVSLKKLPLYVLLPSILTILVSGLFIKGDFPMVVPVAVLVSVIYSTKKLRKKAMPN